MADKRRSWASAMGKPGRNRMKKDRRFAHACHEAAHAVVSFHEGLGFKELFIRGGGPKADPVFAREGRKVSKGEDGEFSRAAALVDGPSEGRTTEQNVIPEIRKCLAGCALECFLNPRWGSGAIYRVCEKDDGRLYERTGGSYGDFLDAIDLTRLVWPDLPHADRVGMLEALQTEAADIVLDNWDHIVRLGTALHDRGHLTYAEAIEVLMGA